MRRLTRLYSSTVGKKVVMATTGVILVLFVLGHMAGNLKAFLGPQEFNGYAEGLRTFGAPFFPRMTALWIVRIVLLVSVLLHIWSAWQLSRKSWAARSVGYRKHESLALSYASRTMRWGGVIIALFVIYHILHFTTGTVHSDFVPGDAYHNLVSAFRRPVVAGVYILAMTVLALHLYHGIWSGFQTLGLNNPKYNRFRRPFAALLTLVIYAGFISVPVSVLIGWIS